MMSRARRIVASSGSGASSTRSGGRRSWRSRTRPSAGGGREARLHEVAIAAPAEVVWEHLTTAEGLVRRVGPDAVADPVPGGTLRWTHANGVTVIGRFVEVVPHRRIVFTCGREDGRLGVGPGSTTVEVDLEERDGVTTCASCTTACRPRPSPTERGWAYFLGVLRTTLAPG
jgi:uncharacterized protein YndB with AHSA1/START domain